MKSLEGKAFVCLFFPHRLISLADMIKLVVEEFRELTDKLEAQRGIALEQARVTGGDGWETSQEAKKRVLALADQAKALCNTYGFDISRDRALTVWSRAVSLFGPWPYEVVAAELEALEQSIWSELHQQNFAFVPKTKVEFFEQASLFGKTVNRAFPSAANYIRQAGNCLVTDMYNGCVFYLMCVAEIGLRALARKLAVRSVRRTIPIERGTWEQIIQALEAKVNSRTPSSRQGQQIDDFYRGVFIEFRAFKDFWRNKVMHVRIDYDEAAAKSALTHVGAFMQRLAERVREPR